MITIDKEILLINR